MTTDDLSAPLGQGKTRAPRRGLPIRFPHVAIGLLSLTLLTFAGWTMIADDPYGGEPMAVVPAVLQTETAEAKAVPTVPSSSPAAPANTERRPDGPAMDGGQLIPPGARTVTIIDGTSGNRQEIVIPAPSPDGRTTAPADNKSGALDARVSEPSRHGSLPKVADDGARPADVFARPVKGIPGKPNAPRIAIVIGGLGIGAGGTAEALRKLPGPVTLAFVPYGADVERQAARGRDGGHEILLQVPMEPFDYPDNDPGPQTLLTSLDAGQNVDRLQWLMSRLQGYVGIVNYMGARFTASEQLLAPVLRETAKRGLIYLDDGASPRSLASQIAGANNLAFAKADVTIDSVPAPADVDRALARLETMARERGVAVGVASALPVSIDRIGKWAKSAESRGVLLVPISAAVAKARSS